MPKPKQHHETAPNENPYDVLSAGNEKEEGQKGQHPSRKGEMRQDVSSDFSVYHATPGPAIPKDFDVKQEGTKEERRAKAAEWNK